MASLIVTSDGPIKPIPTGEDGVPKVWDGVKEVSSNAMFMLLAVCLGTGIGLFSAFATLMEQVLCPWGYTDVSLRDICYITRVLITSLPPRSVSDNRWQQSIFELTANVCLLIGVIHLQFTPAGHGRIVRERVDSIGHRWIIHYQPHRRQNKEIRRDFKVGVLSHSYSRYFIEFGKFFYSIQGCGVSPSQYRYKVRGRK